MYTWSIVESNTSNSLFLVDCLICSLNKGLAAWLAHSTGYSTIHSWIMIVLYTTEIVRLQVHQHIVVLHYLWKHAAAWLAYSTGCLRIMIYRLQNILSASYRLSCLSKANWLVIHLTFVLHVYLQNHH